MSTHEVTPNPVPPPVVEVSEREAWLTERRKGIGGSDVHNLFPCLNLEDKDDPGSRYGCPRRLSYEKLGVEPDYAYTPETLRLFERGNVLEEYAADRYSQVSGRRVFRSNHPYVHPTLPFMRVNLDRNIKADERGVGVFEAKSANEHVFFKMQMEGLPPAYAFQIQHGIAARQAQWGAFGVIESPDYMDAVLEQLEDSRLRRKVIDTLAPKFDFLSFEVKRDDEMIGLMIDREQKFWSLVEEKKLADQLPDIQDERCKSCNFRKTCRGAQFADLNAKVPVRDKKTGIEYANVENSGLVQIVADRLVLMKDIDEKTNLLKAVDNELKQNFPAGVTAIEIPVANTKIRWNYQRGQTRWDSEALNADSAVIGQKVAFADWVLKTNLELRTEFEITKEEAPTLADKYKTQGAPTRPFVVTVKGSE
jgi:hypothetical protein